MTVAFILGILMGCLLAGIVIHYCTEPHYEVETESGRRAAGVVDNKMWLDMDGMRKAFERAQRKSEEGSPEWTTCEIVICFLRTWLEEPDQMVQYGTVVCFEDPEEEL